MPANGEENTPPSVSSVYISSISNTEISNENPIVPSPGTTKIIYIYGNVSDAEGDATIQSVTASFFRTSKTSALCDAVNEADPNYCYFSTCTITTGDVDTSAHFDCEIPLNYYADATLGSGEFATDDWSVFIQVTDAQSGVGDNSGFMPTTEIGSLVAASVQPSLSWGNLDLGMISTAENNAAMTVTQTGNSIVDLSVSGTDMLCSSGSIPVSRVSYVLTDVDGGIALSETPTIIQDFNLPLRTLEPVIQNLFWNISVPENGVGGVCAGSILVTTEAG